MIGLTHNSSLSAMCAQAAAAPYLTVERERELVTTIFETRCVKAIRELAAAHFRYVVSYARRWNTHGIDMEDLIQQGCVGLLNAIERFNPVQYTCRFVTYATPWIKTAIVDYVMANSRSLRIATTKAHRKLFFKLNQYKSGSKSLTPADVARASADLGISESIIREMEVRMFGSEVSLNDDPSEDNPPIEIEDSGANPENILSELDRYRQIDRITSAIDQLDDRSRFIVYNRLVAEEKVTLREMAERFSISAERVRQLEKQAIGQIQELLKAA